MANFTRSKVFETELINRHPQANAVFESGVVSIFRQWTALELAVSQGWGGFDSQRKADQLIDDVLTLFQTKRVDNNDIALLLEETMDQDFQTVCEDNSPNEIGILLCNIWSEVGNGNFSTVNNIIARETSRNTGTIISNSQGVDAGGDVMSDDDEDDDNVNNNNNCNDAMDTDEIPAYGILNNTAFATNTTNNTNVNININVETPMSASEIAQQEAMEAAFRREANAAANAAAVVVDEDGFMPVKRKGKGRR